MPFQVSSGSDNLIFPDGVALEVSTDSGASWTNLGVLSAGTTVTYNYDLIGLESGNKGSLRSRAKNEKIALAPSTLWSWDVETWSKFSGGLFTYSSIAGTPVSGASQVVASGDWAYNKFIEIENQNGDGSTITINSVTGGTDGALVSETDYFKGRNERGIWGIFVKDSVTVTTLSQTITIDYDYTPATGRKITAGQSSKVLSRFYARLRHYTDDALTTWDAQCLIYGVDMDSGLNFNFKGANEDGVNEITVAFTGNVDTSKTSGAQLFEMTINDSALIDA